MVYVDNHDVRAKTRAMDADNAARTLAMDAKIATVKAEVESDNATLTLAMDAKIATVKAEVESDNAALTLAMDAKIATVKGLAESDNAPLTDMGPSNQEVSDSSGSDAMAVGGLVLGALGFLFGAACAAWSHARARRLAQVCGPRDLLRQGQGRRHRSQGI